MAPEPASIAESRAIDAAGDSSERRRYGSLRFFQTLDSMMNQAGGTPSDYESQVTELLQGTGRICIRR